MIALHRVYRISVLLLPLALTGCSGNGLAPPVPASAPTRTAESASLHAVMSQQLVLASTRLNSLLFDLHRTETELARERQQQFVHIAESARSLGDGATRVQELARSLPLETNAGVRFDTLAGQLESQARDLATLAETGWLSPQQMERFLSRIDDTCSACHALYRNAGESGR